MKYSKKHNKNKSKRKHIKSGNNRKHSQKKNKIMKHKILYARMNRTHKLSKRPTKSTKSHSLKTQAGGEFLGSGGFAICVVTPPFKCSERPDLAKYMNTRFISKLVEYKESRSSSIEMEIKHGETVSNVDPQGKYFAPVMSNCYFTPQKHVDVVYKRRNKASSSELYYTGTENETDESDDSGYGSGSYYDYVSYSPSNKCTIHKDKIYMNLILRNAGRSIKKVLNSGEGGNMTFAFIKNNVKKVMFHLCNGLLLLHNNHIAHKDVKPDNITIKYNSKGKKSRINYIDFGLSETVYAKEYTDYEYVDLLGGGTLVYTPPDIRMLSILIRKIIKHYRKDASIPLGHLKQVVISDQRMRKFERQISSQFYSLNLRKGGIKLSPRPADSGGRNRDKFYSESERNKLYEMLIADIMDGKLEKEFFGPFGYFYKWDVYSLGLVFTKFVKKFHIADPKCIALINNMITLNYKKRYTVKDCLADEYFKGVVETEFVEVYENYPINKELHRKGLHVLEDKLKHKKSI